jgi:hypothetical protein
VRLFSYDESSRFEKNVKVYDTFMSAFLKPRFCFFLPLENLFLANLSRNHIEKQVFNIGDLSPM